jgi:2-amino-4-hydroxy-6-hydroxymethyldihydropteridine diphosphokinase
MPHLVCLVLGSNIEPDRYLPAAIQELMRLGRLVAVSSVWRSTAIGSSEQPDFCNAALLLETEVPSEQFLGPEGQLRRIEARLGRVRIAGNKFAPRTIDIDLCCDDSGRRAIGGRPVPDPDLFSRACVAKPVSELRPVIVPGETTASLQSLAGRLQQTQPLTLQSDTSRCIADLLPSAVT